MPRKKPTPEAAARTLDLFGGGAEPTAPLPPLTPTVRRVVDAAVEIGLDPPDAIDFLHTVLCQVGMPRKMTESRVFERSSGAASMLLEAGRLWRRGRWVEQPLPYGTRPRLVMIHISSEAVRTKSREIEVGDSMRDFLVRLGIGVTGGANGGYTMFKKQMEALAACRLTLGMSAADRDVTINTQPIRRFEAWLTNDGAQRTLWPGVLELSEDFFSTLVDHAVPLDHRALAAVKHSTLSLDIYTWLAHRLCRVRSAAGTKVSWANLRDQFGQEYTGPNAARNFKTEFKQAIKPVLAVYQQAKVDQVPGGLLLKPSPPPVSKTQVLVSPPKRLR